MRSRKDSDLVGAAILGVVLKRAEGVWVVLAWDLGGWHWEALEVNNDLWEQVAARVLRARLDVLGVVAEVVLVLMLSLEKDKTAEVTICGRIVVYLLYGRVASLLPTYMLWVSASGKHMFMLMI